MQENFSVESLFRDNFKTIIDPCVCVHSFNHYYISWHVTSCLACKNKRADDQNICSSYYLNGHRL